MKKTTLALTILMTLGVTACSALDDKLVTDTKAVEAANEKVTSVESEVSDLTQKLSASNSEVQSLTSQLKSANDKVNALTAQLQAATEQNTVTLAEIDKLTEARNAANTEVTDLKLKLDAATSESETLKAKLAQVSADLDNKSEALIQAEQAKADAEAAKAAAEQAKTEAEQAKTELEQAKTEAETRATLAEQALAAAEIAKDEAEASKAAAEAEKAAVEAEALKVKEKAATDIAKAYAEVNNITADLDNPNTAALKEALSSNESTKALIQKVEDTADNTATACQAKTCGVYVAATETAAEKGVKTGGLVYNYDKSYIGYGVLREEAYEADGTTRLTTPANSVFYYVSTPTTDKAQVTNATYTGNLSVFIGNAATSTSLAQSTFKLVVQDASISGGIEKAAGKGNAITFENATIDTNENGVVAFNGNVTFNDDKTWGLSATGLSSFSGTYEGQFGGENASEVVGTFKTDDKAYLPSGSTNKIEATKVVYGAFGATTTK